MLWCCSRPRPKTWLVSWPTWRWSRPWALSYLGRCQSRPLLWLDRAEALYRLYRPLTECERDILLLLSRETLPRTMSAICELLEARKMFHGENTVRHTLPRWSRERLDCVLQAPPKGYRITDQGFLKVHQES